MFDRLNGDTGEDLDDKQKSALVRKGLLSFAINNLATKGEGFGGSFANGLQGGLLAMDQGAKDISNARYKNEIMARTRRGMDRNAQIERLGQEFQGKGAGGGFDYEGYADAVAPYDPDRALDIRAKVAPKGRKNPGAPIYMDAGVNENGESFEAPFVWSEEQGGYVPAGQYVAPSTGFLAPDGME